MILGAKNNIFRLEFPVGYFFDSVCKKYEPYIKRLPIPYDNVRDFMNSSVQSVSFPAIEGPTVEQKVAEDPIIWKGYGNLEHWMGREFTVTFRLYEGYLNYWIMFDQLRTFYSYENRKALLPDLILQFMDNNGYEFIAFRFGQTLLTSISELELSFSSNMPEGSTFTCNFKYNYPEILNRKD